MVRNRLAVAGAVLTFLCAFQKPPEAKPAGETPDSTIVVTGTRERLLETYIEELTRTRHDQQIARWNGHICPRAVGLDPGRNGYLAARVIEVAKANGVPVERGACTPNLLIVVTDEADRFAALLLERHPLLFGSFGGRPPASVVEALRAQRPVRWVNTSAWGNADGAPTDGKNNFIYSASRLQTSTRQNAVLSLVIVDANKVQHITWLAFSAYLAMVSICLPPADLAPPQGGTILSLFEEKASDAPSDLTRWDRAYLRALYKTDPASTAGAQRRMINNSVRNQLDKE